MITQKDIVCLVAFGEKKWEKSSKGKEVMQKNCSRL